MNRELIRHLVIK